jgi:hypothetical protein
VVSSRLLGSAQSSRPNETSPDALNSAIIHFLKQTFAGNLSRGDSQHAIGRVDLLLVPVWYRVYHSALNLTPYQSQLDLLYVRL